MDFDNIFKYHAPTEEQKLRYETLRRWAKEFAEAIVTNTPPSADQTAAIRHLRTAVMTANAAIACQGK